MIGSDSCIATESNGKQLGKIVLSRCVSLYPFDQLPDDALAGAIAAEVKQRNLLLSIETLERVAQSAFWGLGGGDQIPGELRAYNGCTRR